MTITNVNYVEEAENVIKKLKSSKKGMKLTTSKIRNILMMVTDLYNEAIRYPEENLSSEIASRVKYMKVRLIYEVGRDVADDGKYGVEDFVKEADLINIIDGIKYSKEKLLLFCRYMEALVAYHKFYGGKDK